MSSSSITILAIKHAGGCVAASSFATTTSTPFAAFPTNASTTSTSSPKTIIPRLLCVSRSFLNSSIVPSLMSSSTSPTVHARRRDEKENNNNNNLFISRTDRRELLRLFASSETLQFSSGLTFDYIDGCDIARSLEELLKDFPNAYRSITTLRLPVISQDIARALQGLCYLENLQLDGCFKLFDSSLRLIVESLGENSNLKRLSVAGNNVITVKGLKGFKTKNLVSLDLSSCMNVDTQCVKALFPTTTSPPLSASAHHHAFFYPKLQDLNLSCTSINNLEFLPLFTNLRSLNISCLYRVTASDLLKYLPSLSASLEVLNLSGNPVSVTDESIVAVQELRHLSHLDLSHCNRLTNKALTQTLSDSAFTESLKSLSLASCGDAIDNDGLCHINAFKNLHVLNLSGLSKMTHINFIARRVESKKTSSSNQNNNNNNLVSTFAFPTATATASSSSTEQSQQNLYQNSETQQSYKHVGAIALHSAPLHHLRELNVTGCSALENLRGLLGLGADDDLMTEKMIITKDNYQKIIDKIRELEARNVELAYDMSFFQFPNLHTVILNGCSRVMDPQLKNLTKLCFSSLKKLDLSNLALITSVGVHKMFTLPQDQQQQQVEQSSSSSSATTVPPPVRYFSTVEMLNLQNCKVFNHSYLLQLLVCEEVQRNLREVCVAGTMVTAAQRVTLRQMWPALNI